MTNPTPKNFDEALDNLIEEINAKYVPGSLLPEVQLRRIAEAEKVALPHLTGIDTLETRKSDGLDFHEVAVWELRQALQAAYMAGLSSKEPKP